MRNKELLLRRMQTLEGMMKKLRLALNEKKRLHQSLKEKINKLK